MIEKLKLNIMRFKDKIQSTYKSWNEYKESNFGNTDKGLHYMCIFVMCIVLGDYISNLFPIRKLGFIIGIFISIILIELVLFIIRIALQLLLKNGIKNLVYELCTCAMLIILSIMGSCQSSILGMTAYAVVVFLALMLLGRSLWAFTINAVRTKTIYFCMSLSGIIAVIFIFMLSGKGFIDQYIGEYIKINKQVCEAENIEGFEMMKKNGKYKVSSIEYSPFKEGTIKSSSTDLSRYVVEENTFMSIYRSFYQDFSLKNAPIAGKIWYPVHKKDCPVIFMIHGNHSISRESYLGYDYLGKYLASYGYIFVSVDENVLNERNNENDARAILLLENIKMLKEFNEDKDNPLYGIMDYDNIALAGHSRGGEAITIACFFNKLNSYPDNGAFKFDYNFNIKALLAIAPTVSQYTPSGHMMELNDINYLVLQGANDQDVCVFMGNTQYDNINFTKNNNYIKSSLYIAGANHGQFNTKWGRYDVAKPVASWLNVGNFIAAKEQRGLLNIFAKIYFDRTLKDETEYADLLTNYEKYAYHLPKTVYIQQYETSDFELISDFEEDAVLESTTSDTALISTKNMAVWTEELLDFSNKHIDMDRDNHALYLKWKDTDEAFLKLNFKNYLKLNKNCKIQFDICDRADENIEDKNRAYQGINFKIILEDDKQNEAYIYLKDCVTIYPPLPIKLSKVQYLFDENEFKHQFQTVSISADKFITDNNIKFNFKKVKKIIFDFKDMDNGRINIDNIGIVR